MLMTWMIRRICVNKLHVKQKGEKLGCRRKVTDKSPHWFNCKMLQINQLWNCINNVWMIGRVLFFAINKMTGICR